MSESHPASPGLVSLDDSIPDESLAVGSTKRDHHESTSPNTAEAPASLDAKSLDQLFREARTPQSWSTRPVERETLVALYDLVRLGPTSGNCCPARFVFLTSDDMKARLRPSLSAGNIERCLTAPVIILVCHDPLFFEHLPRLSREENLRNWFAADVGLSEETAFRNGSLQGGYMILAARALGLDIAPFSGFDSFTVEDDFLSDTGWRINFIAGLGYAEAPPSSDRAMRLAFDETCLVL